ncbi:MAG: Rieske 2Fe-2S domain-containing protein [Acidobacteriota bacterium]
MTTSTGIKIQDLAQPDRVHRRVYADPEVFQEEMRRIFKRTWLFVGHESEVARAGDYKTDTLVGQPIVMTRDGDDQVHVLFNRCRHRGAKVCNLPYGNSNTFSCLYHGWTYSNSGDLIAVPSRELCPADFDPASFGLIALPRVASYRGFVFASLTAEGSTLAEHLGRATVYLDRLIDRSPEGEIEVRKPVLYQYPGNWKFQVENYVDNIHARFTHESASLARRALAKTLGSRFTNESMDPERERPANLRLLGNGHVVCDYGTERTKIPSAGYGFSGRNSEYVALLEKRYGSEQGKLLADSDIHIIIYPNLLLHTQYSHYRVVKPEAVDRTTMVGYPFTLKGVPDELNREFVRAASDHVSASGAVQVDDMEAFARCQEGLAVEGDEWVLFPYGFDGERPMDENGETVLPQATELVQLAQYEGWKQLMARD